MLRIILILLIHYLYGNPLFTHLGLKATRKSTPTEQLQQGIGLLEAATVPELTPLDYIPTDLLLPRRFFSSHSGINYRLLKLVLNSAKHESIFKSLTPHPNNHKNSKLSKLRNIPTPNIRLLRPQHRSPRTSIHLLMLYPPLSECLIISFLHRQRRWMLYLKG